MHRQTFPGIAGLILLFPALALVTTGLLEWDRPDLLVHPVLVMGGLGVALGWNAISLFSVSLRQEGDAMVGTIRLRLTGSTLPLVVLGLATVLLAAIAAYLLVENFQPRMV